MKILWISHNVPYPPKTGVLQRNYNLIEQASRIGDVYLLAMFQRAILPVEYDMAEVTRELGKLCRRVEILELPTGSSRISWYALVIWSLLTPTPYSVNWVKSKPFARKIQELVGSVGFDIVHFDTIGLAEYRHLVGQAARVLNHHNIESSLMRRRAVIERNILKKFYYWLEAIKLRSYERSHGREFECNITVSDVDRAILKQMLPYSQIEVISNGVDTNYFSPAHDNILKNSLIFVGGMNWYPNRDAVTFLCRDIWPVLKQEIPRVSLTIVGAQPPPVLMELASHDDSIRATGFVDDVRSYLRAAEVYICPMRDGGGTRLKILDALSMEKAIVSTRLGCEGIDVQPEEDVLFAESPLDFARQIKRVFTDSRLRQDLGRAGRRLVESKYSWTVIGRNLNDLYTQLCAS